MTQNQFFAPWLKLNHFFTSNFTTAPQSLLEAPLLPHKTSALSWSLPFKTLARREKFLPFKTLAPIYQPREEPLA